MDKGEGKDETGDLDGGHFLKNHIYHAKELWIYSEGPGGTLRDHEESR